MKLEGAKKLHNVFKSNLNEILRERYKSEEQKSALENTKLLYKLMIIIQLHLRLNTKQFMEKEFQVCQHA